ncbi:MAG: abhydrolase domain-containing 18 [Vicinamibacteraceae bacterium]
MRPFFHAWERRIHAGSVRVVRPFDWGLDWLPRAGLPALDGGSTSDDASITAALVAAGERATAESEAFFAVDPAPAYELDADRVLRFESGVVTPHPENNLVQARYFPAENGSRKAGVVLLPQWNSDAGGHIGLARLLARFGMSGLRLSLPYHDVRMPPELTRADYIVSANVGRTLAVCRQAVLDARRAVMWMAAQGYERVGILGTSLGSCLSMLTAAHEPLLRAAALNHVSPYFADVVWDGLSTEHVREGLEGRVQLDALRRIWLPISPQPYLERMRDKRTLLVYARYDLTFPVSLSRQLIADFGSRGLPHQSFVLPCGHYSTGVSPFKWMDGYVLTKFLHDSLVKGMSPERHVATAAAVR